MQSSSEEECEDVSKENPWRIVRSAKSKKTCTTQTKQHKNLNLKNKYTPCYKTKIQLQIWIKSRRAFLNHHLYLYTVWSTFHK
jgi:hypothetical protein